MSQPIIAASAKIQVILDTEKAKKDLEGIEERQKAIAGEEPEMAMVPTEIDSSGAPRGPKGSRARRDPDSPYSISKVGRELWTKTAKYRGYASDAVGGGLYDQVISAGRSLGTIGPVPVGAIAASAEIYRQYGPGAGGFVSHALRNLGAPEQIAEAAAVVPTAVATKLNDLHIWATAVAPAVDSMKALVVAKSRYDGTLAPKDVSDITDFGLKVYEAERLFTEVDARKNMWINERVGGALADLLSKTTVGNTGR